MVIFITGASRGIGAAMVLHFAALGHDLVINSGRDKLALEKMAEQVLGFGGRVLPLFGDISDYSTIQGFFNKIMLKFGKIDCLINNAALSHVGFFADMKEEEWQRLLGVNLGGVLNCCHLAVPHMLKAGGGSIINISSVWGQTGASCEAVYSMTKGGVNAFTRALAKELGPSNIRVNAIACGLIDTQMNDFLSPEELMDFIGQIPLRRQGKPKEVADMAEFLLGAKYVTGQIINLDGGIN